MRIKFWGVRGSIPTPENRNHRYGGNTSCVEVRLEDGTLFVLDCGSGGRACGKSLQREFGDKTIYGYFLMTHFHWDHIQGIPFFSPLYRAGNAFAFLSVRRKKNELRELIEGQLGSPHFPVDMSVLLAGRNYSSIDSEMFEVETAQIRTAALNHPQGSVAYRIDADGGSLVFATDTEPGSPKHDQALRELAQGADILIYDAQYTPEQLQHEKVGWGHSSWLEGVRIAHECGVHRLILFHHDPDSDDEFVDGLVARAREVLPLVEGAAEGLEITLPRREITHAYEASIPRKERRYPVELPMHMAWGENGGSKREARGLVLNVSKSAVYFLTPENVPTDKPLDVYISVPTEITGLGPSVTHLVAQPIRQHSVNRALDGKGPCTGVVARRLDDPDAPGDLESRSESKSDDE